MGTDAADSLILQLRRAALPAGATDGQLLGRFAEAGDQAAFAELVQRHGPMVWGVCRRLLRGHDAEDAFQATFLVLFRKAPTVAARETVGNWLYGVARRTALQARRAAARRGWRERQVAAMPEPAAEARDRCEDHCPVLDEELARLPDRYRSVVVLCDLEGLTRAEAARRLGCPEGTVGGRLARARALLAARLARRGVSLPGGVLAAALGNGAGACVPPPVVAAMIRAVARGPVPAPVAALTERVLRAMLLNRFKAAAVVLLAAALCLGAAARLTQSAAVVAAEGPAKGGGAPRDKPAAKPGVISFPAVIEQVDADARTVTVIDRAGKATSQVQGTVKVLWTTVTISRVSVPLRPTRLQNLPVSPAARVRAGGKAAKLSDLRAEAHVNLQMTVNPEGKLQVTGIEEVDPDNPGKAEGREGKNS